MFKSVRYVYEICVSCFAYTVTIGMNELESLSLGLYQITGHITIQIVTCLLTVVIACKTLMKKGSAFRNIGFFQYIPSPLYQPCSF